MTVPAADHLDLLLKGLGESSVSVEISKKPFRIVFVEGEKTGPVFSFGILFPAAPQSEETGIVFRAGDVIHFQDGDMMSEDRDDPFFISILLHVPDSESSDIQKREGICDRKGQRVGKGRDIHPQCGDMMFLSGKIHFISLQDPVTTRAEIAFDQPFPSQTPPEDLFHETPDKLIPCLSVQGKGELFEGDVEDGRQFFFQSGFLAVSAKDQVIEGRGVIQESLKSLVKKVSVDHGIEVPGSQAPMGDRRVIDHAVSFILFTHPDPFSEKTSAVKV